jgi:flagellar biosynthesis protein FlhG
MDCETLYDVLGVSRRATRDQIDKAHHFLRQMYDDVSLATYSLLDPEEKRATRARVNHAYEVLGDPVRRREYDVSLDPTPQEKTSQTVLSFPPGAPSAAGPSPPRPESSGPATILKGPVTGEHLRRLREQKGVSLQTISTSSKIGVRFFEYIEADRHSHLPARVYLRSFLQEYAKALGLDPNGVADAYIARLPKA